MKNVLVCGMLVALFIGCGPSAEQLNTIKNLTTEIMGLANGATEQLGTVDGIVGMITRSLAQSDTLLQKFPKDAERILGPVTQLKSSKDQIVRAKEKVGKWISAFKAPNPENMKFEEVVKSLTASKDEITSASGELTSAISIATSAVDSYRSMAGGFLEKPAAKSKKK